MFITPRYIRLAILLGTIAVAIEQHLIAQIHYNQGWVALGMDSALKEYVACSQTSAVATTVAVFMLVWLFAPQRR